MELGKVMETVKSSSVRMKWERERERDNSIKKMNSFKEQIKSKMKIYNNLVSN